jgi:hypothetical protein
MDGWMDGHVMKKASWRPLIYKIKNFDNTTNSNLKVNYKWIIVPTYKP